MDCDCPIPAGQLVPPPDTGPIKVLMMGQRYTKNGQTVTKPVGVAPDGSMMLEEPTTGYGDYVFVAGDGLVYHEGILVTVLRGASAVPLPPLRR